MLTTIENLKAIRDISANLKDQRIQPYIKEVEDAYVLPAIGAELYEKLDAGETTDTILLDGGYYDKPSEKCAGGKTRARCYGIRLAVAFYAYARVLKNNQINVTAFGVTQKTSPMSAPTGDEAIEDAVSEARKMGDLYLHSCVEYLHRESWLRAPAHGGAKLKMEIIR